MDWEDLAAFVVIVLWLPSNITSLTSANSALGDSEEECTKTLDPTSAPLSINGRHSQKFMGA